MTSRLKDATGSKMWNRRFMNSLRDSKFVETLHDPLCAFGSGWGQLVPTKSCGMWGRAVPTPVHGPNARKRVLTILMTSKRRSKDGCKNANDGEDHEQFYQRERGSPFSPRTYAAPTRICLSFFPHSFSTVLTILSQKGSENFEDFDFKQNDILKRGPRAHGQSNSALEQ
jgi:hypothetical protein